MRLAHARNIAEEALRHVPGAVDVTIPILVAVVHKALHATPCAVRSWRAAVTLAGVADQNVYGRSARVGSLREVVSVCFTMIAHVMRSHMFLLLSKR